MPLQVRKTFRGWSVLAPLGRMDAHTSPELERAMLTHAKTGCRLAVDLATVDYLSSAGLRALLELLKAVQAVQGRVVILGPRASVLEVLEVTGFTDLFEILQGEDGLP